MEKEIALVDCNNFFVGCEQMLNPNLIGQAVCVLSNNDGCVVARSNEAKNLGISMGMPYFMAKHQYPNVVYLSSNMKLYHDIAIRIRQKLKDYSPFVEVYSIDEAFLDVTGIDKVFNLTYEEIIEKIKFEIQTEIGVPVSVGLANSKILAKLATEKAKKQTGTLRIKKENIKNEIKNIPIEAIWGVGRNTANLFKRYGIFTAIDILDHDDDFYKRVLGKRGLEIKHELMGESVIKIIKNEEKPKSLQRTSSFPNFSSDKNYIKETLNYHLHNVCSKMRQLNLSTKTIVVMLRTKDFQMQILKKDLEYMTNSEFSLSKEVNILLEKLFDTSLIYRSSGVFAENLKETAESQLNLFEQTDQIKSDKISKILDKIESKYGRDSLKVGYFIKTKSRP